MLLSKKRQTKLLKALRFTRLPTMPFILNIEPGNVCNLKCPRCARLVQEKRVWLRGL